ncbi:MAG: hypothetical protein B7Z45_08340 [Azorhizobium sp. 12-66-6]|nr:MAG: hypothetical protein B7Z45_08340 [Azorhizobium sp. 12-66-6]
MWTALENAHIPICMTDFARKIREIRKNLGMNQAEFAAAIGATQGSVSKWETGRETPRSDALSRIASFTGFNLLSLRTGMEHFHLTPGGMRATRVIGTLQAGYGVERITWDESEQFEIVLPMPKVWQKVRLTAWLVKGKPVWEKWPPGAFVITAEEIEDDEELGPDDIWPSGFDYESGEYVVASIKRGDLFEVCIRKYVLYDDYRAGLFPVGGEEGNSNRPVEITHGSRQGLGVTLHGLVVATIRYEVPEYRLMHIPDD